MISKLFSRFKKKSSKKQELTTPFYEKYEINLEPNLIENGIAISLKYKYVYARIFKAGNSTAVSSLYFQETGNKITGLKEIQDIKDNYFTKPSQLSENQLNELQSFFKFTIVRNPYSRLLSCYLDKIKLPGKGQRKHVLNYLGKEEGSEISFDHFLDYLANGGLHVNGHWAPQTDFLVFPVEEFDFIGKLENINKDLRKIIDKIYSRSYEMVSIQQHMTHASTEVKKLTQSQLEIIYQLYKMDFENFNYSR